MTVIRFIRTNEELPIEVKVEGPPPSRIGFRGSVESFRSPSVWLNIMERSWEEANQKLLSTIKEDLKIDPAETERLLPCLVDIKEARNVHEEERIRASHRRVAKTYAGFLDRMIRYDPEYRQAAYDYIKQEIRMARPLIHLYLCDVFRAPAMEIEGKRVKKKKS